MNRQPGYFTATRHPLPCFLFLLPLLVAYEGGVLWLGGTNPDTLRNGADTWLRWALESFGLIQLYWAPILLAVVFFFWAFARRKDQPGDLPGVVLGMAIESISFALGLWAMSRALEPVLQRFGVALACGPPTERVLAQIITFVGAGIYEEVLFRLLLFTLLKYALRLIYVPTLIAVLVAALISSALFSWAHHIGPFGETFRPYVFLFRTLAGLYFAVLLQLRGFGVAVATHACYDVLVGVPIG